MVTAVNVAGQPTDVVPETDPLFPDWIYTYGEFYRLNGKEIVAEDAELGIDGSDRYVFENYGVS